MSPQRLVAVLVACLVVLALVATPAGATGTTVHWDDMPMPTEPDDTGGDEDGSGGDEDGSGGGSEDGSGGDEDGSGGDEDGSGDGSEDGSGEGGPGSGEEADDAASSTGELLFYRRTAGDDGRGLGEYYDVDAGGELDLVHALTKWSTDHKFIIPLEMDGTPGDELLFYRPQPEGKRGWGEYYDVSPSGGMRLIRRMTQWSIDHEAIVPIDIDGDGTDELVFYRRDPLGTGQGWGEIYDLSPYGGMALIAQHTQWRSDHDMVIGLDIPGR